MQKNCIEHSEEAISLKVVWREFGQIKSHAQLFQNFEGNFKLIFVAHPSLLKAKKNINLQSRCMFSWHLVKHKKYIKVL